MRALLLPLAAAGLLGCGTPSALPLKADISGATLTLGPGRVQGGDASAPSGFQPTLSALVSLVPAYKGKDTAELRVWSVPLESQRAYAEGAAPGDASVNGKPLKVLSQSMVAEGALLQFEALWEGPSEGRFIALEIWRNGSRLAASASAVEVHYLPAAPPQGRDKER